MKCLNCQRLERENQRLRELALELWAVNRVQHKLNRGDWNAEPVASAQVASLRMFLPDEEAA